MDMFDFDLQLFAEGEASETTATTNETVAVTAPTEVATTTTTETTNNEPAETHEAAETNDAVYLVTDPRTGRKRIVSEKPQEDEQPEQQEQPAIHHGRQAVFHSRLVKNSSKINVTT